MKKENINVTKYTFYDQLEEEYEIFLIPNNNEYFDIYLQKHGYGTMKFQIGLNYNSCKETKARYKRV